MITPVILAGGSGTRLWPLSRKSYPKQFADLGQPDTLFQATVKRLTGQGFRRPVLLTSEDYRFIVTEQMGGAGVLPEAVFIEPEPRDTAPAVLVAALFLHGIDPDGLMLIAPADHAIPDSAGFRAAVEAARGAAQGGAIVTFGITPDRPETGYGYLELTGADHPEGAPEPLKAFVEKPNVSRAKQMIASGNFLWNAGIFLVSVKAMRDAFQRHAPEMIAPAQAALDGAEQDLGFRRLDGAAFGQIEKISLDYAIMEKA
ncbi:MAG: mannose-1-phosphate guanylyltransferase, partial [Planktotalea sp.]|uniref:mannose-1-phosphate guanylyltransferase n=1 Tax=Planktotalea sp. TaxID=2029877 RepID=UPI003C757024